MMFLRGTFVHTEEGEEPEENNVGTYHLLGSRERGGPCVVVVGGRRAEPVGRVCSGGDVLSGNGSQAHGAGKSETCGAGDRLETQGQVGRQSAGTGLSSPGPLSLSSVRISSDEMRPTHMMERDLLCSESAGFNVNRIPRGNTSSHPQIGLGPSGPQGLRELTHNIDLHTPGVLSGLADGPPSPTGFSGERQAVLLSRSRSNSR